MFINSYYVKGLAHISYLLGAKNKCVIIDPRRDVDEYIRDSKDMGYEIAYILQTHLHADFISGHMDLAEKTGAVIVGAKSADMKFRHKPVSEGDIFELEHLRFSVLETPGHTPEHICYVVQDLSRGDKPCSLFSGDTLFVGDAGRPDLFPGRAGELAEKLFHSLQKLTSLPDFVEIYPAHGAGSLCGKAISAKRSSTIGYEKLYNPALQHKNLEDFKKNLLQDMPSAPDHFKRCSAENRRGPESLSNLPSVKLLKPTDFYRLVKKDTHTILDVRETGAFCAQHIPGSINIDVSGNFPTFAGWLLPVDKPILLVVHCTGEIEKALTGLRRVGLDHVTAVLEGGMYHWVVQGFPIETIHQLPIDQLREKCINNEIKVIDVRSCKEFNSFHMEKAINIPVPDIRTRYKEAGEEPAAIICNSGQRSAMAASILQTKGIKNIFNVPGGLSAWRSKGFSKHCPLSGTTHGPLLRESMES